VYFTPTDYPFPFTSICLNAFSHFFVKGRNLAGKVGLFPQSYTQPAPGIPQIPVEQKRPDTEAITSSIPVDPQQHDAPSSSPGFLLPLLEEPEPSQSTGKATPNGEVMRATLTDVQKAIEQLGKQADGDGARSITFSSIRDGDTTDHDTGDESDAQDGREGENWYKATRQKLAERARQQVEAARAREVMHNRATIPPIDVDISDESADEEDEVHGSRQRRSHPHIPEEVEEESEGKAFRVLPPTSLDSPEPSPVVEASDQFIVPSPLQPSSEIATATQASFPIAIPAAADIQRRIPSPQPEAVSAVSESDPYPEPSIAASLTDAWSTSEPLASPLGPPSLTENHTIAPTRSSIDSSAALPSPAPSSHVPGPSLASTSSSTRFAASSPLSQTQTFQDPLLSPSFSVVKTGRSNNHPNDWSVEEVVDWLRSRGFDDTVCDKFIGLSAFPPKVSHTDN
jgi:hypothetical protein